jgi:argininosuccinate synthase
MKITSIVRFGVAALAMGASFGVNLPVKADQLVWVRAQKLDYFRARGLVPPGSYSHNENQKPATIAVNKAGQGVGDQKQTASKTAKKSTQHVRFAKKDSQS